MAIDHYGIHIGILYIRFYGLILMSGALGASYLTYFQAQRKGENGDYVWDALLWVLIAGIIGARIWHILTPPPSMIAQGITTEYYLTHPLDALAIWNGGLGIAGAVAGGILALFVYLRSKHASFAVWADLVAPGLALGQAIGRWGNFINEELYGAPSNLPWAIYIDPQNRLPAFRDVAYYHPLFLYESIWDLANMFFLLWLGRRYADRLKAGDIFLVYLITYPVGRFLLEFVRLNSSMVAGINVNQYLMLAVIILSALALYLRHRHTPAARETGEGEGAALKKELP